MDTCGDTWEGMGGAGVGVSSQRRSGWGGVARSPCGG